MKKTILVIVMLFLSMMYTGCFSQTKYPDYSYRQCSAVGCTKPKVEGSGYCYVHVCSERGCMAFAVKDGYCKNHQQKAAASTDTAKLKNTQTGNTATRSSNKVRKTYTERPDCDDYEDMDDFFDDWDGDMPDGFDAEDYWDNW